MLKSYGWVGWVAHVILVSAQVLLVLTLGLQTRTGQLNVLSGKTYLPLEN